MNLSSGVLPSKGVFGVLGSKRMIGDLLDSTGDSALLTGLSTSRMPPLAAGEMATLPHFTSVLFSLSDDESVQYYIVRD